MKYIVDGENPERPVIFESLQNEDGTPAYCSENLVSHEESGDFNGDAFNSAVARFYEMLYNTIENGAELIIKPEMAADIIRVIEACHGQNPMPVMF